MSGLRSKLLMGATFIALPYYMLRCKKLLKDQNSTAMQKELKRYGDDFLGIRGISVKTFGEEHYLDHEKCIFVSNHQSHNDIFILLSCLKKPFRFIAKKELFTSAIFKNFMKLSQSYPLDRDDDRASLLVLKQAVEDINHQNASVVVFPEGTRSRGKTMNPFKAGLFSMLRRADAPIIPIYIKNSYDNDARVFEVYFGEPIINGKKRGPELCEESYQAILKLQNEYDS